MRTLYAFSLTFAAGILAGSAVPAYSQQQKPADTTFRYADTIVVQGKRTFSAAGDTRFRAADFALRPRNSAQDILRVVPGLVIARHGGGGKAEQIFLRGFDCDHGTDINVRVDDAPVNMVSHGHGQGYADLHFVIPETIDRIEVVKGPYFARYGDFTTAGAVTFLTADTLAESLVKMEGGSFETFRGVALLKTPVAAGADACFGGEVFGTRGYFEAPQNYRRVNLFAKVHSRLNEGGSLSASLSGFGSGWDASGQIPERAVASGAITRFGSINPLEGGSTSRTTAVLRYNSGGISPLTLTGSVTDYRFRLFSDFTFFLADSVRGDMIEQTDDRSVISLKGEKDIYFDLVGSDARLRIGVDLRNDDISAALYNDSARVRTSTVRDAQIEQRQFGLYAEQEIDLAFVRLLLGLRSDYIVFDVENLAQSGAAPEGIRQQLLFSPKANLALPFGDQVSLFVNSGFGFHSNDARVVVAEMNQRTLPRAFGAEVGMRYESPDGLFAGSAAAWLLDLQSEYVYVGDAGTTEPSGRSRRTGIDMEGHLNPTDWLTLGVDATVSRGRSLDDPEGENYIPLAPTFTLSANALVRFGALSAAVRLRAVSDRPANESNTVRAPGYSIVDLSASYRIGPAELFVNVENLLDASWNEAQFDTESRLQGELAPVSELHFTPGSPLSLRGGLAYRF